MAGNLLKTYFNILKPPRVFLGAPQSLSSVGGLEPPPQELFQDTPGLSASCLCGTCQLLGVCSHGGLKGPRGGDKGNDGLGWTQEPAPWSLHQLCHLGNCCVLKDATDLSDQAWLDEDGTADTW